MFELTINGTVYQFQFGMKFLKEINKKVQKVANPDSPDIKQNVGLQFAIAGLIDGDPETLVDVLETANKTERPRVTLDALYGFLDNEETDIDAVCEDVLDFLKQSNATKKVTNAVVEMVEKEKAKIE